VELHRPAPHNPADGIFARRTSTIDMNYRRIQVIDSHTAGEPTRVVIAGGPELGGGDLSRRLVVLREQFDSFRRSVVLEPRGSDVLVGALLCPPVDPSSAAAVIFFNNVGYLGMCGHGMIGVVTTLAHLGRIGAGDHWIETPVGRVGVTLRDDGRVSIRNIASYRLAKSVSVDVEGYGTVTGDVAWGGNWFFLVEQIGEQHGERIAANNVQRLTAFTCAIRQALQHQRITGASGAEIDHIEVFGPPTTTRADSKNFVLCPGLAFDRSPCGTGTSAKLACLVADGKLAPGQVWRQEGILGTVFEGEAIVHNEEVIPVITARAFVTAEATLLFDAADPFQHGISLESI
jgi:4-hydroxyproline epimerase